MIPFILGVFLLWRVGLFFVGYVGLFLLPTFGSRFPYWQELLASTNLPDWLWSWGNFDGVHYLTIAQKGYQAQFTQAFFPLYPLLIRLAAPLLAGNTFITALLLSNMFTLIFLVLFAQLLLLEGVSQTVTKWTIFFTLVFPFSFFFGAGYSESLFLTLTVGSFIASKKRNWFWAGVLGALASATRLVGIFLLPALLVEGWRQNNFKILWLFLIPTGLISYMWYLGTEFGDPFYFIHAQPAFGASRTGGEIVLLPQVIWRYLKIFTTVPISHYDFWVAVWEFGSITLFSFLFFINWRKIRYSYLIYSLLVVFTPTFSGTFSSMPRYILTAFPLFLMHGWIKGRRAKTILAVGYAVLLILFTILFLRGYWVS